MPQPKYDENVRRIRKISKKYLLEVLSKNPLTSKEILKKIKHKYPEYCDDTIMCSCGRKGSGKEWQHQVRFGIQDLKFNKKIEFNNETRKYSKIT